MKTSNLILIAVPLSIAVWSIFNIIKLNIEYNKKMKQIDEWYKNQIELLEDEKYEQL